MVIKAGEFKAKCLKIMDTVNTYHHEVIVTKYGKPVAKLVPVSDKKNQEIFGFMKDSVTINNDITRPIQEKWNADK